MIIFITNSIVVVKKVGINYHVLSNDYENYLNITNKIGGQGFEENFII